MYFVLNKTEKHPPYGESVGITEMYVDRYSDLLRAGRSWGRTPVGARFSAYVQTGPKAHPASYTMGTRSFLGVKLPGRGADHPLHPSPRLK